MAECKRNENRTAPHVLRLIINSYSKTEGLPVQTRQDERQRHDSDGASAEGASFAPPPHPAHRRHHLRRRRRHPDPLATYPDGDRYPPINDKQAYLYRLARNVALDRLRAGERREALFASGPISEEIAAPAPSAERHLIDQESLGIVLAAIAGLSPRCREVFILRKVENLRVVDIAERLGISPSMVTRHLQNALTHCMARLADTETGTDAS